MITFILFIMMSLFTVSFLATRAGVFGLVVVALFMVSTLLGIMVFLETAMFFIESTIIVLIEEFGILFAFVNFMDDMFSFYRMSFVKASLFIEFVALFTFFALFLFLVVPVSWDNLHQTYRSNTQYVSIWVFFSKKRQWNVKISPGFIVMLLLVTLFLVILSFVVFFMVVTLLTFFFSNIVKMNMLNITKCAFFVFI